jgi:hypothetical protein
MLFLRWLIGAGCALGLAALALILTVGKGFDAFRSAETGSGGELWGIGFLTLLAGMLVSVFVPSSRLWMHGTAVIVAAAAVGVFTILRTNSGEGSLYLAFFALWLVYYYLAMWARR